MDAQYLSDNVGAPLAKALASCTLLRPEDPIEYIALYLLKYVNNWESEQLAHRENAQLKEEQRLDKVAKEYEELKLAEGRRANAERRQKHLDEEIEKQKALFIDLESKLEVLNIAATDDEAANTYRPPLHHLREKERVHREIIGGFKEDLAYFLDGQKNNLRVLDVEEKGGEPTEDVKNLARAVLLLLGSRREELSKWRKLSRDLKKSKGTLANQVGKYSCLKKQSVRRFA